HRRYVPFLKGLAVLVLLSQHLRAGLMNAVALRLPTVRRGETLFRVIPPFLFRGGGSMCSRFACATEGNFQSGGNAGPGKNPGISVRTNPAHRGRTSRVLGRVPAA